MGTKIFPKIDGDLFSFIGVYNILFSFSGFHTRSLVKAGFFRFSVNAGRGRKFPQDISAAGDILSRGNPKDSP
jgi:hypothetical protein